jgi:hypothetical protein
MARIMLTAAALLLVLLLAASGGAAHAVVIWPQMPQPHGTSILSHVYTWYTVRGIETAAAAENAPGRGSRKVRCHPSARLACKAAPISTHGLF